MGNFGTGEFLFIGMVALIIFGPQRFPEIAKQAARGLREFRNVTNGLKAELKTGLDAPLKASTPARKPATDEQGAVKSVTGEKPTS